MKTSIILLQVQLTVAVVTLLSSSASTAAPLNGDVPTSEVKTQTFLSPPFFLRPGDVSSKFFYNVDFPRGHLAIKGFNGEIVDESGTPVPLHETYLHHWVFSPYYAAANDEHVAVSADGPDASMMLVTNSGPCKTSQGQDVLYQYYGLGAETRRTDTWLPDPYAIVVGDPARAPGPGYELRWFANVHAIDTRSAADNLGCTECTCDAYNVTVEDDGCCYDGARCRVSNDANGEPPRKLFLRYTVSWAEWSDAVVPVRIYIFDVTDTALLEGRPLPDCKVFYNVDECSSDARARKECVDMKATQQRVPRGGDIVYAVAHLHRGGIGSSLHCQDGRLLCKSTAIYGTGQEAGNEEGYVVGMSTCYPKPGTVKVRDGEVLTVVANYSSERRHNGVMGHFYTLVAEEQDKKKKLQQPPLCFSYPIPWCLPRLWSNM